MSWSVILPEAGTNKVLNPVAMGTGNYSAVGANTTITIITTASYAYLGYKCYSILVDPASDNHGINVTLSALTNSVHYVTVRLYTNSTMPTAWDWSLDNSNFTEPTLLSTEGNWYVYGCSFIAAQANASTTLYMQTKGSYSMRLYIGHIQVEANTYPTTPIMGDIKGFTSNGYSWNGVAHTSTSTRAANERSGGKVVDLNTTYNYKVRYGVGTGMPPIMHHTRGMALLPGSLYQGHKVQPRVLDLVSAVRASTPATVSAARKNFINAVKPDRVSPEQPIVFRYSDVNTNRPVDYYAFYDSGMEFQLTDGITDMPVARFICYDPFCYEPSNESASLTVTQSVSNADYVVRKINGTWYNISTDFGNNVLALVKSKSENVVYIGGAFTNVGDGDGDYIVKWNPNTSTLSSLKDGAVILTDVVYDIAEMPNGDVIIVGDFVNLKDANGDYITRWDGAAFNSLSTGLTGRGRCVACSKSGYVYIGGEFTNLVDANGDRITRWDGGSFSSLGSGVTNGAVYNAYVHPYTDDLYIVGSFTAVGGVSNTSYIALWSGGVWNAIGTGITGGTGWAYCMVFDKAGNFYVGGDFTSADGVTCNYIAYWNGKTFSPCGTGVAGGAIYSMALDDNGLLWVGGAFTSAGGLTIEDGLAIWNGNIWSHPDLSLPGSPTINKIIADKNNIYIGYSTAGTATTSYLNTVTNNGSSSSYPIINIQRTDTGAPSINDYSKILYIKNETTGDTLWLNYQLSSEETLTIDLTPGTRRIYSSFFGDQWSAVLRSSDLSSFKLQPGANSIAIYMTNTGSGTSATWVEWKLTHWGADMVAA